jgi:hypothetical protein
MTEQAMVGGVGVGVGGVRVGVGGVRVRSLIYDI